MKFLFIGDASAAHYNLAQGLRSMGHEALVVGSGGGWRNHPCDISIPRNPKSKLSAVCYILRWLLLLPRLRGYDVVQFVGPHFIDLKAERRYFFYNYLCRHNRHVVLTALGDDYFWAMVNERYHPFRYGDFNIGTRLRNNADAVRVLSEWQAPEAEQINRRMADDADMIMPVLYEYWLCYDRFYHDKTCFMPLPVVMPDSTPTIYDGMRKIRVFIGIQRDRSEFKGTDIMMRAAQDIARDYAEKVELTVVENVPYDRYIAMLGEQDIILDQLYSYTPAMNALIAMARGVIVVGGGEPENYEILNETVLRPIVNVQPCYESCYEQLQNLILHPERIPQLQRDSIEYVRRHHDYIKVAQRYLSMYRSIV